MLTRSELDALYRSPLLPDVLVELPGYAEAAALVASAAQAHRDVMASGAAVAPSTSTHAPRVVEALRAGKPVPTALGKDIWQAQQAQTYAGLAEEAVVWAYAQLAGERDALVQEGLPTLLGVLDRRVRQAADQARAIDLGGAADAESAIRLGVVEAWSAMAAARELYVRSRQGQTVLYAYAAADTPPDLAGFGFIPDYAERHPGWSRFAGRTITYVDNTREEGWEAPPWPTEAGDHEGRFEWLLEHTAVQPWVPTVAQLREVRRAAAEALNATGPRPDRKAERQVDRDLQRARNYHEASVLAGAPSIHMLP